MAVTAYTIATALLRDAPATGSAEGLQWAMWITDAELLIKTRLGETYLLDQDVLDYVIREAVVAQVRRPDDATSVSVSVDDGSVSRQYRTGRGRVTILDEWWDLLSPQESGAFSVSLAPAIAAYHADWCNLYFGATYCSCGADIAGVPIFEEPV